MAEISFSTTNRKGKVLNYKGYEYIEDWRRGDDRTENCHNWRCRERTHCNARLYYADEQPVERGQHSHAPDIIKVTAKSARQALKVRAANTVERPRQIIDEVRAEMPVYAAVKMSSYNALAKTIGRQRRAEGVPTARVTCLADIDGSYFLKETTRKESVLIADTGAEDLHRIIVFGDPKCFDYFGRTSVWLSDGTFSVSPPVFTQLYTVHGEVCGATAPLIYALLPNKCELTYRRFFTILRDAMIHKSRSENVGPEFMLMDFEQSAIIAFRKVFPGTKLRGCNFHFGQSLYRKLVALGHGPTYATDAEFSISCRMLFALAFVPVEDVEQALIELLDTPGFPFKHDDLFIAYLKTTYVGETTTMFRASGCCIKRPLYPVKFWSCVDRLEKDIHRTTNRLEAWHRTFSDAINKDHPGIYQFFNLLCREIVHQQTEAASRMAGEIPRQKKQYAEVTKRLKNVASSYGQIDTISYLRSVAINLEIML
ncbi:uncharacterized protein LOC129588333 [Paramacrobiotus metropolitanus]|uniref:uncharacterized protein LOC129588333 n=1 Tax=Paramacrobiotus metropolitanus TaxID=2943436 RepID=UPI0024463699|nr:uncharacterized protein LOC129588333 [Paramacrobiotus metropolitanus]